MHSLRWKVAGALLLMVAISVGLMAYFTNLNTSRQFNAYLSQNNQRYQQNTTQTLAQFYQTNRTWDNVQSVLMALLRDSSERLVLADVAGLIVGDTDNQWNGRYAGNVGLSSGIPITVSGNTVGTLYPFLNQIGMHGRGNMGGMGSSSGMMSSTSGEEQFIAQTNRSLLISGIIAGILALAVGIFLTWFFISRPLRRLAHAANQLTKGNFRHRVTANVHDEFGELAESFNTMAASLENAENERRRIIADVAHELRTPVTIIEGTVDGIQDGIFTADNERLNVIKEQTQLLTRLTSDLRDLSLAESGQLKLVLISTDLAELIRRKILQFDAALQSKGIGIHAEIPPGIYLATVDPARIEQVLGNLLSNAIRHTPSGGNIAVDLRSTKDGKTEKARPGFLISISDSGEGIAPEHLSHIFERFYRVQTSRSRGEGGAGLGLAIVQRMVEAHQGKVWVTSEVGKGSTFFVWLPSGPVI
jgi:two-component system, OmpR family, sensor histidine kinase BaeS